jgi:Family of unknown function (DUF5683)
MSKRSRIFVRYQGMQSSTQMFFRFLAFFLLLGTPLAAQDTLVVARDTLLATRGAVLTDSALAQVHPKKNFFSKDYPSPQKALLCSAILPGAGQAYNKQYWKIPLVYGAFIGGGFYYNDRRKLYNKLKTEYIARVDNLPTTVPDPNLTRLSDPSVRSFRDKFRSESETAGLLIVVTYLLTAAEAYVGAHLKSFDVSDDLSLHLVPSTQGTVGAGVRLMVRP